MPNIKLNEDNHKGMGVYADVYLHEIEKKPKLLLKSSMSKILSIAIRKERLWKKLNKQLSIAPEFYNTME